MGLPKSYLLLLDEDGDKVEDATFSGVTKGSSIVYEKNHYKVIEPTPFDEQQQQNNNNEVENKNNNNNATTATFGAEEIINNGTFTALGGHHHRIPLPRLTIQTHGLTPLDAI